MVDQKNKTDDRNWQLRRTISSGNKQKRMPGADSQPP